MPLSSCHKAPITIDSSKRDACYTCSVCHQPCSVWVEEDWKKEFDKKFVDRKYKNYWLVGNSVLGVKDFIRNLLSQREERKE